MLRRLPVTLAARALAGELSTRAPRILARVEPEHGHHAVPLYDVGAAARYAERDWTRSEARASSAHSLGLGTPKALNTWRAGLIAARKGGARRNTRSLERGERRIRRQRRAIVAACGGQG